MAQYLRLQNLPLEADNEDIRQFFHDFEIPEAGVHIIGGKHEEAFIAFRCAKELLQALHTHDRQMLLGNEVKLLLGYDADMEVVVRNRIKEIEEAEAVLSSPDVEPKEEDTPPWLKRGKRSYSSVPQKRESNSTMAGPGVEPPWSKRPRYTSSNNPSKKKEKHLSNKSGNSNKKSSGGESKKTRPLSSVEKSGLKLVNSKPSDSRSSKDSTPTGSDVGNHEIADSVMKDNNCQIKTEKCEVPDANSDVQEHSHKKPKTQQSKKQKSPQSQVEEQKAQKEGRHSPTSHNDPVPNERAYSEYLTWFPFSGGRIPFYLVLFNLHVDVTASDVLTWFDGADGVLLVRSESGERKYTKAFVVFKDFRSGQAAKDSTSGTKLISSGWHPKKVLSYLSRLANDFLISVTTIRGTDRLLSSKERKPFLQRVSIGPQNLSQKIVTKYQKYQVQNGQKTSFLKVTKPETVIHSKGKAGVQKFKVTPKKKKKKTTAN